MFRHIYISRRLRRHAATLFASAAIIDGYAFADDYCWPP